jgi:glycosyltransferase involved in cell wall biosynthesis
MEIGYNLVAVPRLLARCRRAPVDLIYERYALYNASAVIVGRLTGTPVVLEVNDTVRMDRTRQGKAVVMPWLAERFERWIFGNAAGLAVVSGYLRDHVVANGVPPERVRVTPNAVEPEHFDPERFTGARVRERLGLEGTVVVGFAGSFTKWHGVEFLTRAFAAVAREFPEARLLLVGEGPRRPVAAELAAELGIADRVVFTGKVPHAEMPEHMAAMDQGVMPSSNLFGSPMKVFEYMAMGRPAVAPRYGPLEEAIDDGKTGLLFPPEDEAALTACLRSLLADAAYREELGRAGRRKVLEKHLWVHNAQAVLGLVARVPESEPAAAVPAPQRSAA